MLLLASSAFAEDLRAEDLPPPVRRAAERAPIVGAPTEAPPTETGPMVPGPAVQQAPAVPAPASGGAVEAPRLDPATGVAGRRVLRDRIVIDRSAEGTPGARPPKSRATAPTPRSVHKFRAAGSPAAGAYMALLPAARVRQDRTVQVPGCGQPIKVLKKVTDRFPTFERITEPRYRTVDTPVYETRCEPIIHRNKVPRYAMVPVKIYGWKQVPNVVVRKREVFENIQIPIWVTREVPALRPLREDIYAYGERPVVSEEPDETEDDCGCPAAPAAPRMERTKTLTGFRESMGVRGVRLERVQEGTKTVKKFKGVQVETRVEGTRRERVVVATRMEQRIVGYDTQIIHCGVEEKQVKVGVSSRRVKTGTLDRRVRTGYKEETRTIGYEAGCEICQPGSTRTVVEWVDMPARAVTVVPDGTTMGSAPMAGTDGVMTRTTFEQELARRQGQ